MHLAVLLCPGEVNLLVDVFQLLDLRVQVVHHGTLLRYHEGGFFELELRLVHFLDVLGILRRNVLVELVAIHLSVPQRLLGVIEDFFRFQVLTTQLSQVLFKL